MVTIGLPAGHTSSAYCTCKGMICPLLIVSRMGVREVVGAISCYQKLRAALSHTHPKPPCQIGTMKINKRCSGGLGQPPS